MPTLVSLIRTGLNTSAHAEFETCKSTPFTLIDRELTTLLSRKVESVHANNPLHAPRLSSQVLNATSTVSVPARQGSARPADPGDIHCGGGTRQQQCGPHHPRENEALPVAEASRHNLQLVGPRVK